MAEFEERPRKKPRFFAEESPAQNSSQTQPANEPSASSADSPARPSSPLPASPSPAIGKENAFDRDTFIAFVGQEVDDETIRSLQESFGNNLEQAINAYFDGSWKAKGPAAPTQTPRSSFQKPLGFGKPASSGTQSPRAGVNSSQPQAATPKASALASSPEKRYIGALGVTGWATRSGRGLIKPGDNVRIERTKQQVQQKAGKGRQVMRRTQDLIVRFTNARGDEIGRLEKESAAWISGLIDQKVCSFEGNCIYAPDLVRTNDNVYLQLRCFLLKRVFESGSFIKPLDSNRQTTFYEAQESNDERDLRLRQIGLVKLFSEINLDPAKANEMTKKHKKEGILQAVEIQEQYENQKDKPPQAEGSSPPSEEGEEGEELEQDQLDSLYKKAQSFDFDTPEAQPADTFVMDLRKYQKQALHWMLNKETSQQQDHKDQSMHPLWEEYLWPTKDAEDKDLPVVEDQDCFYVNPYSGELSLDFPVQEQNCLGGILADEMGLGKTIEMMSLIHSHRSPEYQAAIENNAIDAVSNLPRLPKNSAAVERAPATTLVVAPMSLLAQWASEAEKASKEGSMKVLVYYGSEKSANLQTLCCAANAASAPNVIVTSYGTVLSEYNAVANMSGNRGSHGGLFSLEYWRIILDEAHMVKNRLSKTAKACYELAATHRWVLTGTPIVNRLEDLFSLVHFLRVEPWSNFSFWKTFITFPFEKGDFIRALDVVQTVLEPLVMRRTKDMKTPDGEALVPLPPRTIEVEKVKLSEPEREVYSHIFQRAKRTFNSNIEAGTLMKSYTTIFAQILRLRQSCCHPILTRNKNMVADEEEAANSADIANGLADDMDLSALLERFEADTDEGDQDASRFGAHVLRQIQDDADMECPICSEEPMEEQAVTGCWHSACKQCLLDYIEHQSSKGELPRCFNCREPITARDVFQVVRHEDDEIETEESAAPFHSQEDPAKKAPRISLRRVNQLSSSKIAALLVHLKKIRKHSPTAKSVVFSQFTSFLDLITPALQNANITYLRFDGSMSQKHRASVLAEFASRPTFTILLLSLRAGGVGLNLTCAQRVFMMDPWWSWAVEAQAIDRVHRMGQTMDVEVVRFVVEGSIEEKMLRVQERKKFLASSLGMMSEEEKKVQRLEDIRELLSE